MGWTNINRLVVSRPYPPEPVATAGKDDRVNCTSFGHRQLQVAIGGCGSYRLPSRMRQEGQLRLRIWGCHIERGGLFILRAFPEAGPMRDDECLAPTNHHQWPCAPFRAERPMRMSAFHRLEGGRADIRGSGQNRGADLGNRVAD